MGASPPPTCNKKERAIMKKGTVSTIILILVLIIGLSFLLYPALSDYWNKSVQSKAVASYVKEVENMDEDDYDAILGSAAEYNEMLTKRTNRYKLTEELRERYPKELSVADSGMMGDIEVPSINVFLPIYHTTDEDVLQVAIGHIDWSSLPVGGEGTHSVLSSHRGLPSAKLFTDLDKLREGDLFMIYVLDEVITYEVDQILTVLPEETDALMIEEGRDLCTLVTCTPYGVNSHRLLVRGHRVENQEKAETVRITSDALIIEKMVVVPFVLAPILVGMLVALIVTTGRKKNKKTVNEIINGSEKEENTKDRSDQ